jgi:hypothetical protein
VPHCCLCCCCCCTTNHLCHTAAYVAAAAAPLNICATTAASVAAAAAPLTICATTAASVAAATATRYPYAKLAARDVPEEVDRTQLEAYLDDDEFEQHLGMPRDEFAKLAKWKQQGLKKKCNLN